MCVCMCVSLSVCERYYIIHMVSIGNVWPTANEQRARICMLFDEKKFYLLSECLELAPAAAAYSVAVDAMSLLLSYQALDRNQFYG